MRSTKGALLWATAVLAAKIRARAVKKICIVILPEYVIAISLYTREIQLNILE
jgi:hypothetical protein